MSVQSPQGDPGYAWLLLLDCLSGILFSFLFRVTLIMPVAPQTALFSTMLSIFTCELIQSKLTKPANKQAKHVAGMFPVSGADFEALNAAVERLTLNDASVAVKRENSAALGAGFRCGYAL